MTRAPANPGLPDLENDRKAIGREPDLQTAAARLRQQGWLVTGQS